MTQTKASMGRNGDSKPWERQKAESGNLTIVYCKLLKNL